MKQICYNSHIYIKSENKLLTAFDFHRPSYLKISHKCNKSPAFKLG